MRLNFSTINFDVQLMIAKKMDFWSVLELQLSSKQGQILGDAACTFTLLEVEKLVCEDNIVRVFLKNPFIDKDNHFIQKHWSYIREYPKIPNLSVSLIVKKPNLSVERLDYFESVIKEDKFLLKKSKLQWSQQKRNQDEIFLKLVEVFNITSFTTDNHHRNDDTTLMSLPEFQKLESVFIPDQRVSEQNFLSLQANSIEHTRCYAWHVHHTTINKFFKQWLAREREIRFLKFKFLHYDSIERFFHELPVSLVCSNVGVPGRCFLQEIYLMDRGDKKLRIEIDSSKYLTTRQIDDYADFEKEIELMVAHGKTKRPNENGDFVKKKEKTKKFHFVRSLKEAVVKGLSSQ